MNFFYFKLNITRKGSKILYSLALFFIIFFFLYTFSYSQEKTSEKIILSEGTLTDEQFFGEEQKFKIFGYMILRKKIITGVIKLKSQKK